MPENDSTTHFDIIIVGAGLTGLVAAQRLLQAHPETNLAIFERDYCLGGVWSKRRTYPSFWTQWTHGIAEFSDMPMVRPPEEDCMNDLFRAKYTTKYLENYADFESHNGATLRDRIHFNMDVQTIRKIDGCWRVLCTDNNTSAKSKVTFVSEKLMMANGQSSLPNLPDFPGKEHFKGKVIHSVDFGESDVIQDTSVQHISVIGAGKSSADMVYEAVKAGKTVSWIIRKTGDEGSLGAAALAPIDLPTPYKNGVEASQARIMASLQPSYLIPNTSWWTWFLHSTSFGAGLVNKVFGMLDETVRKYAGYRERESNKGFEKLEYDNSIIWQNGTAGGCHFPDFWSLVAEKVFVYRSSIKFLSANEIYLNDEAGTHFLCDAVLCGTGWKRGLYMFDNATLMYLGLPFSKDLEPQGMKAKWDKLVLEADEKVLKRFVMLRNPPEHYHRPEHRTPYRLYHTLAPVHDGSILFMNHIVAGAKLFAAEAQAIWAVAYWDNAIKLPSVEEREKDVAHMIAWNKRRYMSNGELGHFAAFDSVPYVDRLFDEMGMKAHRRKGWVRNMFAPIMPADSGMVWAEYLASRQEF